MARFSLIARPFFRRHQSKQSNQSQSASTTATTTTDDASHASRSASLSSLFRRPRESSSVAGIRDKLASSHGNDTPEPIAEQRESVLVFPEENKAGQVSTEELPTPSTAPRRSGSETLASKRRSAQLSFEKSGTPSAVGETPGSNGEVKEPPQVVLQEATPARESFPKLDTESFPAELAIPGAFDESTRSSNASGSVSPRHVPEASRAREQSLLHDAHARLVSTEVELPAKRDTLNLDTGDLHKSAVFDYFTPGLPDMSRMLTRKIWVRRPGASATLVQIKEEDLVDDVRDMILRKYANSLGKTFDAPDMLLRISARAEAGTQRSERILGPEEEMCRTIDLHYPGGQTVEDALIIDVPSARQRTPRPSPRVYQQHPSYHTMDEHRPVESGTDYFPPMPAIVQPTMPQTSISHDGRVNPMPEHQRSISVLSNGHLPALPSPGGTRTRHLREHRPKYARQHTSSPTIVQHPHHAANAGAVAVPAPSNLAPQQAQLAHRGSQRPRVDSTASERPHLPAATAIPPPPPPTPPAVEAAPTNKISTPPTPSGLHANRGARPRKGRKLTPEQAAARSRRDQNASDSPHPGPISNMLDASIPPINVLIVEDNIINLRILEGLMKRLRVRWETAMNGQIAVDKWRKGGYHLVLMDIQMPIMNGLQATKEIRRLEKVNGIGVFSSSAPSSPAEQKTNGKASANGSPENGDEESNEPKRKSSDDQLPRAEGTFKSPVIIVALTASSLQSDRHEALAAGCNDFLTKPVNFVWLERKVKEWGCMQALIDFDGWRRWKDFAVKEEAGKTDEQRRKEQEVEEKQKKKMEKLAILQERQKAKREEEERKKRQRVSVDGGGVQPSIKEETPVAVPEGGERGVEEKPGEVPIRDDV